jgi:hypothetical protein
MRKVTLFLLVVMGCPLTHGQKQTPSDPFGLAAFGFESKLEGRPLITPSEEPPLSRACGAGVYLREETVTVNNKAKKIKIVIVYFLPNPNTMSAFNDTDKMTPDPLQKPTQKLTNLPPGVSSFTFFWPPKLRTVQETLLMRAEKKDKGIVERTLSFPAELNIQEGDTASILWSFDNTLLSPTTPEMLGNQIVSNPVMLKVSVPRGTKKCLEGK